jgi:hypothetical protein
MQLNAGKLKLLKSLNQGQFLIEISLSPAQNLRKALLIQ